MRCIPNTSSGNHAFNSSLVKWGFVFQFLQILLHVLHFLYRIFGVFHILAGLFDFSATGLLQAKTIPQAANTTNSFFMIFSLVSLATKIMNVN